MQVSRVAERRLWSVCYLPSTSRDIGTSAICQPWPSVEGAVDGLGNVASLPFANQGDDKQQLQDTTIQILMQARSSASKAAGICSSWNCITAACPAPLYVGSFSGPLYFQI